MRVNGNGGPYRPKQAEVETNKPATSKETPARGSETRQTNRVSSDGFESTPRAGAASATARSSGPAAARNLPAEVRTPASDYYRQRYDDFVRRNPGMKPPDYYLNYGQKYLEKFSSLGPKDLTPAGQAWRDRTLQALQDAIESKRAEDPVAFAQLERDPEAFKKFAYDTHADAYVKSGLFNLPAQDLVKIATTPELRDLLGKDGVRQIVDVIGRLKPEDLARIGGETVKELGRAIDELRKNFKLPKIELPQFPRLPLPSVRLPWQ
ncbi:hypothetical protein [Hyalangium rubrum]|uniref:Uncharacterized protein n=1 Tax=Hyalangium rubrum TaxID=3103134 RepID=A0ABU5GZI8_9BACT|nr:hypothetical protein [Hyalangium sp. s54d21]MDY7226299.1 hypothetical protein [Hyalangium sp. s54d21]